jgi:hypothetical protein
VRLLYDRRSVSRYVFVVLRCSPVSLLIGVCFVVSQSWCGVSRLLVAFLRVQVSLCVVSFRGVTKKIVIRPHTGR